MKDKVVEMRLFPASEIVEIQLETCLLSWILNGETDLSDLILNGFSFLF
jgi:hypothetical protein